ncbi:5'-methylthioadenosine/S-adenosylhomocysteine nucleosidase [Cellulomonas xiejunii]|uniref:5'-methylthioadenosine/S-adenosylhomocysteine nucleosidase n=1 Tax=Cellulomonas xiejunii TaxID=2968083 RepID=UPI001D0DDBF1|nr:5'-methylthioadenosine/S-adenosylhomocysteine nucleosidase [Cellulomonas xiejunii]MCC2315090.1 5'-methylthioadenosine/S-adenosylhomocysteine nucleosidase [Cellulomonas xiejunii]MCC2315705.1 5'-methylthioadenosine/S-adenosylhomocysteine nucleosidase [Cellulomonas xiejunii]
MSGIAELSAASGARADAVVVTAMGVEASPFLDRASAVGDEVEVVGARRRVLDMNGARVLLVTCGIGIVNAASAATLALHGTGARVALSAGSAGGLGLDVRVGDVVVGATTVFGAADARVFGYALGQVPGMPAQFDADPALLTAAAGVDAGGPTVRTGLIVSSDVFVDAERAVGMRDAFPDALACDMESTALAQAAYLAGVPFLSVRGISDLCGPIAGVDFSAHVDDAAERSATVVVGLLDAFLATA